MIKHTSNWLQRLSTGWTTLLTLVVFLVFSATVLPRQATKAEESAGGGDSPDMSLTYTSDDLYRMAEAYGDSGRKAYIRARFTFDLIFPLVYTAFLVTSISWTFGKAFKPQSRWQLANLAPVLGMVFDFLENGSTSLVMARYPAQTSVAGWLAPIFTFVKWFFVGGSFVLLFIGAFLVILGWVRPKLNPTRS